MPVYDSPARFSTASALLFTLTISTGCSNSSDSNKNLTPPTNKTENSTPTLPASSLASSSESHLLSSISSSSISSSSISSSSSSVVSEAVSQPSAFFNSTPCSEFSAAVSATTHNTFIVDAPLGDCIGVLGDGAQKRELPLRIASSNVADRSLRAGSTVKIYNSYEQGRYRWSFVTIEVTNTSKEPICFINPARDLLSLYDHNDQEVALISVDSYLNGSIFPLAIEINTNTCLAPGQTLPYSSKSLALPVDVVNAAAYAVMPPLEGSVITDAIVKPSPSLTNFSASPEDIRAEFVNNTGETIDLSFSRIIYYSADGYAVDFSFMDRQDTESDIVESGDLFILEDDYPAIFEYRHAHATRAIIYLDWESVSQP